MSSSSEEEEEEERPRFEGPKCVRSVWLICGIGWACFVAVLVVGTFCTAVAHNQGCNPETLSIHTPAYGGQILPSSFTLYERVYFFSKLVEVYDANKSLVGTFYDINFLLFKSFGFSDANDRIWFQATKPWGSAFMMSKHYVLQRCDKKGLIFDIDEDWYSRPWFCFSTCSSRFDVFARRDGYDERRAVASTLFNSTSEWYMSGLKPKRRYKWSMNMIDPNDNSKLGVAQQHFRTRDWLVRGGRPLSVWEVKIVDKRDVVPHWVVGFMAALEDISYAK